MPLQVKFSGSSSWDRVWGVRYLLGISIFEEKLEKTGKRSQTAMHVQRSLGQPGKKLDLSSSCLGVLHQTRMAFLYTPATLSHQTWAPLGKAWPRAREFSAAETDQSCPELDGLLTILSASGQQVLPWRGIWQGTSVSPQILTHFTLVTTLWGGSFYKPHFIDEKTESWIN